MLVFVEGRRIDRLDPVQQGGQGGYARQFAGAGGVGQARQGLSVALHPGGDRVDAAQVGLVVGQDAGEGGALGAGLRTGLGAGRCA
ncbi:hypothetical protein D3C87_1862650 [compost metagenome]